MSMSDGRWRDSAEELRERVQARLKDSEGALGTLGAALEAVKQRDVFRARLYLASVRKATEECEAMLFSIAQLEDLGRDAGMALGWFSK